MNCTLINYCHAVWKAKSTCLLAQTIPWPQLGLHSSRPCQPKAMCTAAIPWHWTAPPRADLTRRMSGNITMSFNKDRLDRSSPLQPAQTRWSLVFTFARPRSSTRRRADQKRRQQRRRCLWKMLVSRTPTENLGTVLVFEECGGILGIKWMSQSSVRPTQCFGNGQWLERWSSPGYNCSCKRVYQKCMNSKVEFYSALLTWTKCNSAFYRCLLPFLASSSLSIIWLEHSNLYLPYRSICQ